MASQADVRRIALSLPETEEASGHWVWMERLAPKKPRVPQPNVIAVRVASLVELRPIITEAWRCQAPRELETNKKASRRRN
jgi:hypothetical protein